MKDGKRLVITIGRQFGSGGCEVGTKLAQELGLDFYDKNILRMNSDESGIKESYYKIIKSLTPEKGAPSFGSDLTSADNLFRFQSEVIRKLAAEEDCIIMGRCADYVLEGMEGLVRVFIYADMDFREKRTIEKEYYAAKDAKKNIKRIDRERRDYFRYYTGKEWEFPENYDLMINTAAIGTDGAVETIKNYLKVRGFEI